VRREGHGRVRFRQRVGWSPSFPAEYSALRVRDVAARRSGSEPRASRDVRWAKSCNVMRVTAADVPRGPSVATSDQAPQVGRALGPLLGEPRRNLLQAGSPRAPPARRPVARRSGPAPELEVAPMRKLTASMLSVAAAGGPTTVALAAESEPIAPPAPQVPTLAPEPPPVALPSSGRAQRSPSGGPSGAPGSNAGASARAVPRPRSKPSPPASRAATRARSEAAAPTAASTR